MAHYRLFIDSFAQLDIGVEILDGAASTTVFLEVDGSAGVDLMLSAGANATPTSGTGNQPVVSLDQIETTFGGCVDADVGVSINAGATADLPPFFDKTVSVTLFQKTFPLFSVSASISCCQPIKTDVNGPIENVWEPSHEALDRFGTCRFKWSYLPCIKRNEHYSADS